MKTVGKGMKMCEAFNCFGKAELEVRASRHPTPHEEVFNKTIAFYCALLEKGCAFDVKKDGIEFDDLIEGEETDHENSSPIEDSNSESQSEFDLEDITSYDSRCKHSAFRCQGQMVMCSNRHGRPYIQ